MKQEQSITDILQMLKHSVNDTEGSVEAHTAASQPSMSDEELKQQLKQQYATENEPTAEVSEPSYVIDSSLFDDVEKIDVEETVEEPVEVDEPVTCSAEMVEEPTVRESEETVEDEAPEQEDEEALEEFFNETLFEDVAPWEDSPVAVLTEETEEDEPTEEKEDLTEPILIPSESEAESLSFEEEPLEEVVFPEIKTVELNDLLFDYESEDEVTVEAFSFSDKELLSQEMLAEEDELLDVSTEQLHESVFDLMAQLGCDDELDLLQEDSVSEEFIADPVAKETEEERQTRIQEMRHIYQTQKKRKLLLLLGAFAMTVWIFLYDTLPVLGFEFLGIASHVNYLGAYILLGFQWLLLCALFLGRSLLDGAKKLFTFHPNVYSMITMLMIFTLVYDVMMAFVSSNGLPPMFHFVNALLILATLGGEYALIWRESKIFSVYTSDQQEYQYTLSKSHGDKSIAEQMYDGGLDRSKNVYIPLSSQEVKGEFRPISEFSMENKWVKIALLPIALISVLVMIVAILLGSSIKVAAVTAMVMLLTTLPLHIVWMICLPLCASARSLQKRGIAVTGKAGMDAYAEGDLIVYNDLHLFRPCTAKNTGIVFLEQSQTAQVLGSLERLYSKIGGPLKDVFSEIPDDIRMKSIRIRRIFRNGLEAFVDKKHVLLVGDAAFMRRYGLSFPVSGESTQRSTLCISLDNKVTAKMSIQYTVEPVFEMLAERLYQEGIEVVIETFDPMIQAAMIQKLQSFGTAPISVFHKNVSYLHQKPSPIMESDQVGIVANASRLKLAEAVVWCKRLRSIRKWNVFESAVYTVLGCLASVMMLIFGWMRSMNQYWLLLCSILPHATILITSLAMMPRKKYFTISACQADLCKKPTPTKNKKQKKEKS